MCYYHKHTDGKKYLIPECWGTVQNGIELCTCHKVGKLRLTDTQMIIVLKEENKMLKKQIEKYKRDDFSRT